MRRFMMLLATVLFALTALPPQAQAYGAVSAENGPVFTEFCANLLQSNEAPPVAYTGAFGGTRLVYDRPSRTLRYEIEVQGIGPATLAHIHKGIVGVSGPVVLDLLGSGSLAPGTPLSGSVRLTAAQEADLYSGAYYVNVHTALAPGGELRGQIFPREATRLFKTKLLGTAEVPPVASAGSGEAVIRLNDARTRFDYALTVTGIPSATLAHIHTGPITATGGVIYDLLGSKQLLPGTPLTGTLALTEAINITDTATVLPNLFGGGLYVNVHTVANPGGELRGQLGPATTRVAAELSPLNEVPPIAASSASGSASFDLSLDSGQLEYAISAENVTSTIILAHLHKGLPGANGDVVVDLLAGGTFTSGGTLRGTVFLTPTQITDMVSGAYYVNVHSQAFPGGELRGQATVQQRFLSYRADLSPANEVPPVQAASSGVSVVTIDTNSYQAAYKVLVTGITSTVILGHIHLAPVGVNGPVIFDLLGGKTLDAATPLTGTIQLNDLAYDSFASHLYYTNIHSQAFPGGELRGQLAPLSAAPSYFAGLRGENEVPPVTTSSSGVAELTLDATQTRLSYDATVNTTNTIVAAHIHRGARGQNGPILYPLTGSPVIPNAFAGTIPIQPSDLNDLLLQQLYVNVHTNINPGGEIRGQILPVNYRFSLPIVGKQTGGTTAPSVNDGPSTVPTAVPTTMPPSDDGYDDPYSSAAPVLYSMQPDAPLTAATAASAYICGAHGS